jgi:hypothetical protein
LRQPVAIGRLALRQGMRVRALAEESVEMKWLNGWSVAGTFEGEFSDVTSSYAGKGVARYAW